MKCKTDYSLVCVDCKPANILSFGRSLNIQIYVCNVINGFQISLNVLRKPKKNLKQVWEYV